MEHTTTRSSARRTTSDLALTVLRVVVGIIMFAHGLQKATGFQEWQGTVAGMGIPFPEVSAVLSVAAELGGGAALIIGLLTPLAALGILINMIVAIIAVHLGNGLFAANDGWEYPLTIAAVALFFLFRGAGPVSVDSAVKRARMRRKRAVVEPEPYRRPVETTA